jgi:predicted glycosyltransferase
MVLQYDTYNPVGSAVTRLLGVAKHFQDIYRLAKKLEPSLIIGFGVDAAVTARRLGKPCVIFTDGDGTPVQSHLVGWLAGVVVTPRFFKRSLGPNHIRLDSYKELMYLHPNHFRADPQIYDELGISRDQRYVIARFNSFSAVHDIGTRGFSTFDKHTLVNELQKYAKVFISAEGSLPEDLDIYKLPIAPHRIHHALNFAEMIISDSGTMTVEAAILGTPSIICSTNATQYSNYLELDYKYGLIRLFSEPDKAIAQALEMIQQPVLKQQWAEKRSHMLADKKDITSFMIDLISSYPESLRSFKKKNGVPEDPGVIQIPKRV